MNSPAESTSRIPGFYDLSVEERHQRLRALGILSEEQLGALAQGGIHAEAADHMVENAIGVHSLPLGLGLNFMVNGREVLVPMAVEEPSVVAGASFMAKLARAAGGFTASTDAPLMIGQMQLLDVADLDAAAAALQASTPDLLAEAAQIDPILLKLGGGP